MLKKLGLSLFLMSFLVSLAVADEPRTLTNKDLEKYKSGVSVPIYLPPNPASSQNNPVTDNRASAEFEKWCAQGSRFQKAAESARKDVEYAEERYKTARHDRELWVLYKGKLGRCCDESPAEWRLRDSKVRLKNAEDNLSELEESARRQRIKPGWLRCQE